MRDKLHRRKKNNSDHQSRPLNNCSVIKDIGVQRQPRAVRCKNKSVGERYALERKDPYIYI
ncbi:hypothetical protein CR513_17200, partial [Mucuna pruriens]